jgi:hypothetical protein
MQREVLVLEATVKKPVALACFPSFSERTE